MKSSRRLVRWLPLAALLAGCGEYAAESTRREIYKLAFRTAQFHEALERCEADPKILAKHERVWKDNFDAAATWLDMDRATITARQEAGRGGLPEEADIGCEVVLKATTISYAAADRWASRIAEEEHCGIMNCD